MSTQNNRALVLGFVFLLLSVFTLILLTGVWKPWFGVKHQHIVAIIDTGIDLKKDPRFVTRLAFNSNEKDKNSKDDDQNGYVDDIVGYDFENKSSQTDDLNGHGSKVAASVIDACEHCRILPLKISMHGKSVQANVLAQAIRYAIKRSASVINISLGILNDSSELKSAIEEAHQNNIAIVVAAGSGLSNPYRSVELKSIFPQSYPQVFVVGSSAFEKRQNSGFELDVNLKSKEIEIGEEKIDSLSSSLAAGFVSGLLADYMQEHPDLKPENYYHQLRSQSKVNHTSFAYGDLEPKTLDLTLTKSSQMILQESRSVIQVSSFEEIENIKLIEVCDNKEIDKEVFWVMKSKLKAGKAVIRAPKGKHSEKCHFKIVITKSDHSFDDAQFDIE